ncbi:hypothetical protein TREES_T100011941 [Tupaia chinensis]|uniref:Uncharacterized protein n=1 Tax=Tupaia chinensis TaxID=246437 RepID=L9KQ02_TUPCH|nr:hypothetical protein TREES_T100011941 [Tupaia chinensis]
MGSYIILIKFTFVKEMIESVLQCCNLDFIIDSLCCQFASFNNVAICLPFDRAHGPIEKGSWQTVSLTLNILQSSEAQKTEHQVEDRSTHRKGESDGSHIQLVEVAHISSANTTEDKLCHLDSKVPGKVERTGEKKGKGKKFNFPKQTIF